MFKVSKHTATVFAVLSLSWLVLYSTLVASSSAVAGCTPTQRQQALDAAILAEKAGCIIVQGMHVKGEVLDVCVTLDEVRVAVEILRASIPDASQQDAGTD